jgi:hypothetical protein
VTAGRKNHLAGRELVIPVLDGYQQKDASEIMQADKEASEQIGLQRNFPDLFREVPVSRFNKHRAN